MRDRLVRQPETRLLSWKPGFLVKRAIVTIHLFSRAREVAGTDFVEVLLSRDATVAALRAVLVEQFPALRDLLTVSRIAVNLDFASDDTAIRDLDEVAVIPPVSGG